ncbi:MAG: 16S rRNA (guanine(966)-N(2))-methyltransferase RsmD [Erysipelotrichaceae bacterium]|nr:16S rRNA (guanine(966)-N(2))-methyltransferase RsmD [Solobacterium sp.]MDY3794202.1 16S rRNA (guanine(966)-N(2))-methyltransferase RsmD [Erysipelotrichaceae bacterium]
MRVVAGKYKRSTLLTLDSLATRPTKDMVKEALFSSIYVEDSLFLDLFSGSGSIGIEALSRGARDVVFNDLSKDAVKVIKTNLSKFKEDRRVYNLDYLSCLNRLEDKFDYIFVDPPYAFEEYERIFETIDSLNLYSNNCRIIVEVKKEKELADELFFFEKYKEKKYGISKLLYYRRKDV